MTPGILVDAFIRGILSVTTLQVLLLIVLSLLVAFSRWWFNHYNLRRAIAYSKTAFLFLVGTLVLNMMSSYREPYNLLAWNLIAMHFLILVFVIVGYYVALLPKTSSSNFKLLVANVLKKWVGSLELSAAQSETPISVERQEKQTMDLIKEVVEDHKDIIMFL